MSVHIEYVVEDASDRAALVAVVDKVFRAYGEGWAVDLVEDTPDAVRTHGPGRRQLKRGAWRSVKGIVRRPVLGIGSGNPWLGILKAEVLAIGDGSLLIFHKDTDGVSRRRNLLIEAVQHLGAEERERVIVAIPHPETEAWGIWAAGADPVAAERGPALKARLGFDPVAYPERLSSSRKSDRECKSIARTLGLQAADDVVAALESAPIEHLERGTGVGLTSFIRACRKKLPNMRDPSRS